MKVKVRMIETNQLNEKELTEATREAWQAVGEHWRTHMLPKHFTEAGAKEYRFRRRTAKYVAYKQQEQGHNRPLEYTGRLKQQVLSGSTVTVKASKNGKPRVQIKISGPNYLKGRNSKASELKRVSKQDSAELAEVLDRAMTAALSRESSPEEVRL